MKVLSIIPARGGSKGVPGKNYRLIAGKPLISYTIEAALASSAIDEVWVSSDDNRIIEIAREYKGVHIHKRPSDLALDESPVTYTIEAVLNGTDEAFDAIMLLQPTSPIRTSDQIDDAIDLFSDNPQANSLISVVPMDDVHPARMYWKSDKEDLEPMLNKYEQHRRQEIPTAWYRNGSIYLVRTHVFKKHFSLMVKPSIGFEMPASQLLNIDAPRDLLIAEPLIEAWKRGELK